MKSAGETGWISRRSFVIVKRCIRARSRRSHHSSASASGENCPLKTKPSFSSAVSACSILLAGRSMDSARSAAVTGPKVSSRPRTSSTSAASSVADASVADAPVADGPSSSVADASVADEPIAA